jgi:hypothetical protein
MVSPLCCVPTRCRGGPLPYTGGRARGGTLCAFRNPRRRAHVRCRLTCVSLVIVLFVLLRYTGSVFAREFGYHVHVCIRVYEERPPAETSCALAHKRICGGGSPQGTRAAHVVCQCLPHLRGVNTNSLSAACCNASPLPEVATSSPGPLVAASGVLHS